MSYENLNVETAAPIATITLNRPEVLNALSPALIEELALALGELDRSDEVRAVVLTGGEQVFAAGADISEMAERNAVAQFLAERSGRWNGVTRFAKPLIAAVNGFALGGGCELAMMCDLIIAGDDAQFGQPEVNLGILPGAGGTQRWPRTVGKYIAMEIHLTGRFMKASQAHRLGLVNKVVPHEVTIQVAQEIARRIAAKAPVAARLIKEAIDKSLETSLAEGLAVERRSFQFLFATDDQKEGMRAFLDKRPPRFKGR